MIETTEIPAEGVTVDCPSCRKALYRQFADRTEDYFEGYLYSDGDTVPLYHQLGEEQRRGGWHAALSAGTCPFCAQPFFGLVACFTDAEPDDEFESVYFHVNDDRGEPKHFSARRGEERWLVSHFDTHLGPMLEHEFGPFADTYGGWISEAGVATCSQGGPWDFAIDFLLNRWDELRAMNQLFDPSPGRPTPKKRPLSAPRLAPDLDDDIPF